MLDCPTDSLCIRHARCASIDLAGYRARRGWCSGPAAKCRGTQYSGECPGGVAACSCQLSFSWSPPYAFLIASSRVMPLGARRSTSAGPSGPCGVITMPPRSRIARTWDTSASLSILNLDLVLAVPYTHVDNDSSIVLHAGG